MIYRKRKQFVFIRIAVFCLCFFQAVSLLPQTGFAYDKVPEYVRICLYFNSPYAANKTASSYQIYCENGVSTGRVRWNGEYEYICDFRNITADSQMSLVKYAFNPKYTVAVGREAATFTELVKIVDDLRGKGFNPLLCNIDGWVLIIGLFDTSNAAAREIEKTFAVMFPDYKFAAEELGGKYILIKIGGVIQFVFDSGFGNLRITPLKGEGESKPATLELNGKPYRGAMEFPRHVESDMAAVNYISMDEYLYGVVPREIDASSSPEAVKAQAVTARTYALNNIGKHNAHGGDLCSTTHCQAYGGFSWEDARSSRAVDETKGAIVTYKGAPAQVFYFDSSGGHTENSKNVWGIEYPYLKGVEDNYESGGSQYYNWEASYTAKEIKDRLSRNGVNIGDITGVAVTKKSESGRAIEVTVTGASGVKRYKNEECRTFLGNLRSQLYTISSGGNNVESAGGGAGAKAYDAVGAEGSDTQISGGAEVIGADGQAVNVKNVAGYAISDKDVTNLNAGDASGGSGGSGGTGGGSKYYFVGKGWGHGVGMSQEGAKGMARAGFSYTDIIKHYFPGCIVE